MPCDLTEMLQRQFFFFGTYFLEDDILACWEKAARGASMVFDVGANAGIFSLAALSIQENAIVHAFEPTSEIAARLRETARLNRLLGLHIHELAVSDTNGWATLNRFRGENDHNEGMNYITPSFGEIPREPVQTVTLDQFCRDRSIDRISLLKLDIQGHEFAALSGCAEMISTGRIETLFMELNWKSSNDGVCPATASILMLERAGYKFSKPEADLIWRDAGDWLRDSNDVIASKRNN